MQTSDLNVNTTESDHANAIFRQFQDVIFSREHTSVETLTKIIFDLLQWQKKLPSLPSSQQHFPGIFVSEPMPLPEIEHVSFLVGHAQTFFAGELNAKRIIHGICSIFRLFLYQINTKFVLTVSRRIHFLSSIHQHLNHAPQ